MLFMQLTQAILPVAGLGTRFLPWTKAVPKEMLPIGRMPIIALLVDECLSVGIRDICFVISRGKESIPAFFQKDAALEQELQKRGKGELLRELGKYDEVKFTTLIQEEQHGDGHAILQAASFVASPSVAVLFGDDLIVGKENGLQQLFKAASGKQEAESGAFLCLQDVPRDQVSRYGIAKVEPSESRLKVITGLVEKPSPKDAPSTLAIVGKYIIPRSLFEVLKQIGNPTSLRGAELRGAREIRLIDALIATLGITPLQGYVFEGTRFDTGTPEGYREALSHPFS